MELLTAELRSVLPPLYAQENIEPKRQIVYAKFFHPLSDWTWFVTEGEAHGANFIFFGYVVGFAEEWGCFTLDELAGINYAGIRVERDADFQPDTFENVIARFHG